ncbi:MAG TPA: phytanoyl-CoA dioxygenase family protein [Candidatus Binatia bacterium]|jgi:hypothetical protein|nr:phytanoyl-CoA dioxygenase family protein [Candidatus Binatia bacterium]
MTAPRSLTNREFEQNGFQLVPAVLTASEVIGLIGLLGEAAKAGRRALLNAPVQLLASSDRLLDLVRPYLSVEARPVRAIYFDKNPDVNWLVTWHQDLTLAVRARFDLPSFGPWSLKDGVHHVQAPPEFLEQMIAIRLHLDDCDEDNGALRVLPDTHRLGRLLVERIQELRKTCPEFICRASAGDALLMRPLLLHASSRSRTNRHRRVLHIEYAGFDLPEPLEWFETD